MIVSQILGGIGNQMFQYAVGRALALERGQSLRLDISGFAGYGLHHGFELQRVFKCPVETATEADVRSLLGWQFSSGVRRVIARPSMSIFRRSQFVVAPHFNYWPGINNTPLNCYLVGYWQSEKYFQTHISAICDDFTFKTPLTNNNRDIAAKISQMNAISLHVRRGDYANDVKTNATHGLCSIDYYRDAIRYIQDRIDKPHFFVFSDDIDWARQNIKIASPCQYVNHNVDVNSYNDMRLMSLCQHNIIANSSFSWWGAWLNRRQGKIVIAPRKWFLKDINTSDLIPDQWVVL